MISNKALLYRPYVDRDNDDALDELRAIANACGLTVCEEITEEKLHSCRNLTNRVYERYLISGPNEPNLWHKAEIRHNATELIPIAGVVVISSNQLLTRSRKDVEDKYFPFDEDIWFFGVCRIDIADIREFKQRFFLGTEANLTHHEIIMNRYYLEGCCRHTGHEIAATEREYCKVVDGWVYDREDMRAEAVDELLNYIEYAERSDDLSWKSICNHMISWRKDQLEAQPGTFKKHDPNPDTERKNIERTLKEFGNWRNFREQLKSNRSKLLSEEREDRDDENMDKKLEKISQLADRMKTPEEAMVVISSLEVLIPKLDARRDELTRRRLEMEQSRSE